MPHQEYAISYSLVVLRAFLRRGERGCTRVPTYACAWGASFALLGLKVILREQLAGRVVGGHSVTHLDALKMPLR